MERVGIPTADQDAIFRTVAAILHLGNIQFRWACSHPERPEGHMGWRRERGHGACRARTALSSGDSAVMNLPTRCGADVLLLCHVTPAPGRRTARW